ncbi:MAG: prepilin-type N-terminal cleavage/methylation domain-containing protein [Desulfobacterales bacterium]
MKRFRQQLNLEKGFTLIELLVGLGLAGVVFALIVSFFFNFSRSSTAQNAAATAQQTARAGVDFMAQELRLAGLDPLSEAGAGIELIASDGSRIRFTADRCNLPIGSSGNCTNPVPDGDIDGKNERVSFRYDPASRTLRRGLYEGTPSEAWTPMVSRVAPNPGNQPLFTFLDAAGSPVVDNNQRGLIRTVVITLTVEEPAGRSSVVARTFSARVRLRNIGI